MIANKRGRADPNLLIQPTGIKMPLGKFKERLLCDLAISCLEWFQRKGYPKGTLGVLPETLYEIKITGYGDLPVPINR